MKTNGLIWACLMNALMAWSSCGSSQDAIADESLNGGSVLSDEKERIQVLTTTDTRSFNLDASTLGFLDYVSMSPNSIILQPQSTYQTMQGFGAAVTGSSAYCLRQMNSEDRAAFIKKTFSHTEGYGCSYIRISIGCSDFSLSEYTCCDKPGIENFALTSEEKDVVIPVLKEILAVNPSIKILGSPWTCPLWMKDYSKYPIYKGRAFTSGQLKRKFYNDYAAYFVKWVQAFEKEGIHIEAVTIQNEPLNDKNSASLVMEWEEQRDFVKVLGPAFHQAGITTKIYAYDHNYNYDNKQTQLGYPCRIYEDTEAAAYLAGAAYHDYGGHPDELLNIKRKAPQKDLMFTESSIGTWNHGHDLQKTLLNNMESIGICAVNNGCSAVMIWNLMLETDFNGDKPSENGGMPNRPGGCQTCFGAVDLNMNDLKTLYLNSHYYMICHLSAVVKPGAVRIGTSGYTDTDLVYSAFRNTDGSYAFVVVNKSQAEKDIVLTSPSSNGKNRSFNKKLPGRSVTSFLWEF